jgi:glycerophosphoryl diester phosphodiesterase
MKLSNNFFAQAFAHRGYHSAATAENSMAAFHAGIDAGYGIELDIQPSLDGIPMVFHDYSLDRLTKISGPIAKKLASNLDDIKLSGSSESIPTLAAVLKMVAGRVPLLIEIKDQDGAHGFNVGPLEKAVCAVLEDYEGDVALMSFNPHSVAACQTYAPNIPRGITTCPYPAKDWPTVPETVRVAQAAIPDFDRVGACFISHQQDDLTSPHVTNLKLRGVPIFCWTVRSAAMETHARKIADNVTFEGYRA